MSTVTNSSFVLGTALRHRRYDTSLLLPLLTLLYCIDTDLILQTVEWALPDGQLILASQTLTENHYPRLLPTERLIQAGGEWETTGFIHNISPKGKPTAEKMRVRLYPLSFVGLSLDDTVKVTSTFRQMLSPKPQAYMLSLLQYLLSSSPYGVDRIRAITDLTGFVTHYLMREQCGALGARRRFDDAVAEVRRWDWDPGYLDLVEYIIWDRRVISSLSYMALPNPLFGSGSEDSGEEGEAQGEEEEDTGLAEIVRYREQFILWLTQEQGYIAGED